MIDPAIRARIDQHVITAQAILYRKISSSFFEIKSDWVRAYSALPLPAFNFFLPLTPKGLTDDTLADTAAFFRSREALYYIELVHDRFPHGPTYLTRLDYESLPPQLAMYLYPLPQESPINREVSVERIATVPSLTAFHILLNSVFDFPIQGLVKLFPVAQLKDQAVQHYLAFLDEQPVGAGTLVFTDETASIWNMCTIDKYRLRGVATTLLHHMVCDADKRNCDLMMLYSTAQAYQLYSKYGFEIYTQRQWFLPPGLDYEDD